MTLAMDSLIEENDKMRSLIKVAQRAAITAEFLHGIDLGGEGGSKILRLLDEALAELELEVV